MAGSGFLIHYVFEHIQDRRFLLVRTSVPANYLVFRLLQRQFERDGRNAVWTGSWWGIQTRLYALHCTTTGRRFTH